MEQKKIKVLDSYLRDGAQARNISFSIEDKIKSMLALDQRGVDYVEAGNPGFQLEKEKGGQQNGNDNDTKNPGSPRRIE